MKRTHYKAVTNKGRERIIDRECAKLERRQERERKQKVKR